MVKKILLGFLFIGLAAASSAQYPLINASRPRIFADAERIDWLHNNVLVPGDCQNTFNSIVYAYNNWWINDPQLFVLGSDSTLWNWDWTSYYAAHQAILSVMIYKLNGSPLELKRCRYVAGQLIQTVNTANFATMDWYVKEDLLRKLSDAGGVLLDWCYEDFPSALRDQLSLSMYLMNREFMNTFIYSSAGNSYVSSHNTWNNVFCNQNALVLHQAPGLSLQQLDTVALWYQAVYDKLINGFIPCWSHYRDDDGGWNWGAAYAMWSLVDQFQLFENMRIATNKNFFFDLPWVQNSINQYIYFIRPDNRTIHLGDGETRLVGDRVIYLHARIFDDPRSKWMAQYWSQPALTPNTMEKFSKLLYKDFDMETVSPVSNPLDWWADKVGLSVSLSSWEPDATLLTFYCAPSKKAAHEHRDNNSFTVFKNKPLLIDAGYYDTYGGSHFKNYYTRTIAHNAVCVFDSTDVYLHGNEVVSNDGGQVFSPPLANYDDIFAPAFQRGKWVQYACGDHYSFQHADASLSYDSSKVKSFSRRLLFFKPDQILLFDHLVLNEVSSSQRDVFLVLHTVNQPLPSGNLISQEVPGHIMTYQAGDYTLSNGGGNAAVRTLLPEVGNTTLVGGPGYEYWVNGINYPPLTVPDTLQTTPGNWRLEVRPEQVSDSLQFLHAISTGDLAAPAVAGGVLVKNSFSTGADWNGKLFLMSSKGDTAVVRHHAAALPGNRLLQLWAADMRRNDSSYLFVDSSLAATAFIGAQGVFEANVNLPEGNHQVDLGKYRINGSLRYGGENGSAIPGTSVHLISNQQVLASWQCDTSGGFMFDDLYRGTYTLQVGCTLGWGGCNSTDALLILRHFVQLAQLSGLRLLAADVDQNQYINTIDALYVAKRYLGIIDSFPASDWIFEEKEAQVSDKQQAIIHLHGICRGDVNASYLP